MARAFRTGASSEDRLLLHLQEHQKWAEEPFRAPYALSAEGIGHAIGLTRTAVGVILRKLAAAGFIRGERRTIVGHPYRRTVFFLTDRGLERVKRTGHQAEKPAGGTRGLPAPDGFVNRERELAAALRFFALDHERVMVVTGPPGIGKTAFLSAALARVHTSKPIFYHVFGHLSTRSHFLQSLATFMVSRGQPALRQQLATNRVVSDVQAGDAIRRGLRESRCIVILDNIDSAPVELIPLLTALVHTVPPEGVEDRLILVGRSLPEAVSQAIQELPVARTIRLGGLDPIASRRMLLGRGFTEEQIEETLPAAAGTPFLLKALPPSGRPAAAKDVRGFLASLRADLSMGERLVLARCAIRRLPGGILDIAPHAAEAAALPRLIRLGLIREEGTFEVAPLVAEVYTRLPLAALKPLHREAARRYLETGTSLAILEAIHHLREADEDESAAQLVAEHGFSLITQGYADALGAMLERIREGRLSTEGRFWLCLLRGRVREYAGDTASAVELEHEALKIAKESADPVLLCLSVRDLGYTLARLKGVQPALRLVEETMERIGTAATYSEALDLRNTYGLLRLTAGDVEAASEVFQGILRAVGNDARDVWLRAKTHGNLGECFRLMGRHGQAIEQFETSLDLYTTGGLSTYQVLAHTNVAWAALGIGDVGKAGRHVEAAFEAASMSPTEPVAELCWVAAEVEAAKSNTEEAMALLQDAHRGYVARGAAREADEVAARLSAIEKR